MTVQFNLFLLVSTIIFRPSYEYPVDADIFKFAQEPQKIVDMLTVNKDSSYSLPDELDGQDRSLMRSGGYEERGEGEQDSQDMLSPDAADTMRKINPLTIADQVSEMFRKGGRKVSLASKPGDSYVSVERDLPGEQSESLAQAEDEESPVQPGYVRQVAPRLVSKPGGSYVCLERNLPGEQSESLAQAENEESPVQPGYVRQVAPRIVSQPGGSYSSAGRNLPGEQSERLAQPEDEESPVQPGYMRPVAPRIVSKPGGSYSFAGRNLPGEQSESLAQPEDEESPVQPGYVQPMAPKIVSKPRSNDYGYSVIVLAGDAVHMPIRVKGKSAQSRGKSAQSKGVSRTEDVEGEEVQRQGSSGGGEVEADVEKEGISKSREVERRRQGGESEEEEAPKKEVRVYKQFSKSPDFPLYDEDLNYVPDPFHGLLDRTYQDEIDKESRKPVSPAEDSSQEGRRTRLLRRVRSEKGVEGANPSDNVVACGSWGKQNSTELEPLVINIKT